MSTNHEDTVLRTILTENQTGNVTTNEHIITSVGLSIEAKSNIMRKHRHVFGPLEDVTLSPTLINENISWKHNGLIVACTNGVWSKKALSIPGSENCELRYDDCGLKFKLRTIAPTRRREDGVTRNDIGSWAVLPPSMFTPPPIELWCCMLFSQSLLPYYVSFEHLRVREGSCPAVGCKECFENMIGTYHNPGTIEESTMTVDELNCLSNPDFAGKHGVVTTDGVKWLWGEFRWEIPVKWQTTEDDPYDADSWQELKHKDTQIFNLTNGILSVYKFGCTARRTRISINNVQSDSEVDCEEVDE